MRTEESSAAPSSELATSLRIQLDAQVLFEIEDTALVDTKLRILKQFPTTDFEIHTLAYQSLLFSALRVYHFNDRELYMHKANLLYDSRPYLDRLSSITLVSPRNESRSLIFVWKCLTRQQNQLAPGFILKLKSQLRERMNHLSEYENYLKKTQKKRYTKKSILTFLDRKQNYFSLYSPTPLEFSSYISDETSDKFHHTVKTSWRKAEINGNLRLSKFGSLRGIASTTELHAEDLVISLPIEEIISCHSIKSSPLKILFEVEGLPIDIMLAIFLIFEFYNDNSRWRYYLDMLPMEFDTALYYTPEELTLLTGTTIGEDIKALQNKIHEVFHTVFPTLVQHWPHLFHPKIFVLENLIWAQSVIDSRGIRLNLDGEATLCLLPLVDVINGSTISFLEGNTSVSLDPDRGDCYTIRTLVDIKKQEQIWMNYGAFSNRELLLYYGYVMKSDDPSSNSLDIFGPAAANVYDTYSFDLELDDDDITSELQDSLLKRLDLQLDQHIPYDGSLSGSTLMTFHILLMGPEELIEYTSIPDDSVLGSLLYQAACLSPTTISHIGTVLQSLLDNFQAPFALDASMNIGAASSTSSSPPILSTLSNVRMDNISALLASQQRILQVAISKIRA